MFNEYTRKMLATYEAIAKECRAQAETYRRISSKIEADIRSASSGIAAAIPTLQPNIEPWITSLQRSLAELPERQRKALMTLGQRGWYLDPEMVASAPMALANIIEEGNDAANQVDEALVQHYRTRLPSIRTTLVGKYPHRAKYIEAAFAAHDRSEYCLSIPLFLTQADGICHEVTGGSYFMRTNRRPQTASFIDQMENAYIASQLAPLSAILPINANRSERPAIENIPLNRHEVLHGESLDYDTEANGMRAISLLNYIAYVLRDLGGGKI